MNSLQMPGLQGSGLAQQNVSSFEYQLKQVRNAEFTSASGLTASKEQPRSQLTSALSNKRHLNLIFESKARPSKKTVQKTLTLWNARAAPASHNTNDRTSALQRVEAQ